MTNNINMLKPSFLCKIFKEFDLMMDLQNNHQISIITERALDLLSHSIWVGTEVS